MVFEVLGIYEEYVEFYDFGGELDVEAGKGSKEIY